MRARLFALVILSPLLLPANGFAQPLDSTLLRQVLRTTEDANEGCTVSLSMFGRIAPGAENETSQFDDAAVMIYSVSGCNGGNNWVTAAQVFGIKDGIAAPLGKRQAWSIVRGADFARHRALIYAVDQAPGDAHCCPTDGKTIEVTMRSGQPFFRQLKAWTLPKN